MKKFIQISFMTLLVLFMAVSLTSHGETAKESQFDKVVSYESVDIVVSDNISLDNHVVDTSWLDVGNSFGDTGDEGSFGLTSNSITNKVIPIKNIHKTLDIPILNEGKRYSLNRGLHQGVHIGKNMGIYNKLLYNEGDSIRKRWISREWLSIS